MYPLLWLSLAFLSGLLLAAGCRQPWPVWTGLAGACLGLIFIERRARSAFPGFGRRLTLCPLPVMLVAAFLFLGAARGAWNAHSTTPAEVEYYTGRAVRLAGWVSAPPDPSASSPVLRVIVDTLRVVEPDGTDREVRPIHGQISVRAAGSAHYGDRLELSGELQPPPVLAGFSYREYLARQGVYCQLTGPVIIEVLEGKGGNPLLRFLFRLREKAWATAVRIFPQPEAALLSGIVLGQDKGIPVDLQEAFQATGTAHIIAISGFNITILAGLFFAVFRRLFSRWGALCAAVLATTLYTLFVGAEPPVTRAAVMGALALFGREIGRSSAGLNTLGLTAALMSLFNPTLPFDPSFQLSFFATLGMVLYAGPLLDAFKRLAGRRFSSETVERLSGPVGEFFLTTLAAQITTLPVMAVHFGRLSLVSLLANPLVLPPQPAVMVLSGLAIFAGLIWHPLGQLLAWIAWPFAAYTVRMVRLLAALPAASVDLGQTGWWAAGVYFGILFALPWLRQHRAALRAQLKPALLPAALGVLSVLAWVYAAGLPDGRMHLWVQNPDGDPSLLVKTPGGNMILIGTPNSEGSTAALDAHLPLFRRRLDAWVLAASSARLPDLAPLAGRLALGQVMAPPGLWEAPPGAALEEELIQGGQYTGELAAGQVWDLGGGERLRVLAVKKTGAALLLEWKNFRALLPGGLSPRDLAGEAGSRHPALLVLPSQNEDWKQIDPQLLVNLDSGQPGVNTINLAEGRWLHISTDGEQMWLEVGDE